MLVNIPKSKGLHFLQRIFSERGYEIRIAGGAVRDMLLSKTPQDIDLATTATPEQMKQMFEDNGLKILNRRGEAHGTVAVRIQEEDFEVTTLRIDVATDGRHAEVAFTTDWVQDARRRDLTVNAMFLSIDGTLYDFFNGAEDLKNNRIRFVGEPETRIKEDYLRILRYFRFHARLCKDPTDHDPKLLNLIQSHCHGLAQISGEKRQLELFKILKGNHMSIVMETMLKLGVGPYIGLPSEPNLGEFKTVCNHSLDLQPATLLASLVYTEEQALHLAKELRLTNAAKNLCIYIVSHRTEPAQEILYYQKQILLSRDRPQELRDNIGQLFRYQGWTALAEALEAWVPPNFPLNGSHLKQLGHRPGPHFSAVLLRLKEQWIDSGFQLSTQLMLDQVPGLLEECQSSPAKKLKS